MGKLGTIPPSISVILCTYEKDTDLVPRAIRSLMEQDFSHDQIELMVVHDGPPTPEAVDLIDEATSDCDFFRTQLRWSLEPSGYYCAPRNYAIPHTLAPYISNMDADNEFLPNHLRGLFDAIRTSHPEHGWPHFTYSRRKYVRDPGVEGDLPEGPSPLVPWTGETAMALSKGPKFNFVDTGDMLIGKGTLYRLAELTGCIWNSECRRFGDWDLVNRLAHIGARGRAVDQVSHVYHWTGENLQVTRWLSEYDAIPVEIYDKLVREGKIERRGA